MSEEDLADVVASALTVALATLDVASWALVELSDRGDELAGAALALLKEAERGEILVPLRDAYRQQTEAEANHPPYGRRPA